MSVHPSLPAVRQREVVPDFHVNQVQDDELRRMSATDPPIDPTDPVYLRNPALTGVDVKLLDRLHSELYGDSMELCTRCRERWFDMGLFHSICRRCRKTRDKGITKETADMPFRFGALNKMDPMPLSVQLPKLSQVEEMFISRVHVHVEVCHVRGLQYKYIGHVCSFLSNTAKVYSQLPLLPRELDMVILKPSNYAENPRLNRQFLRDYTVEQECIRIWLRFLKANHPGYSDVDIDIARLTQLPVDGTIIDDVLFNYTAADVDNNPDPLGDDEVAPDPEIGAVPNFQPDITDLEHLRQQIRAQGPQSFIIQPSHRSTPLDEYSKTQPILSLTFPTLFPTGHGGYLQPRARQVEFAEYMEHLIKYDDGRFS